MSIHSIGGGGGGAFASTQNSTTTPLAAGATYTGTAENITSFPQLTITLYATPSTAKASLFLEFSPDGTNWDISIPLFVTNPSLFIPYPLINVGKWFRVRYLNDGGAAALAIFPGTGTVGTPTLQTAFRLTTLLHVQPTKELTRTLAQPITEHQPATVVRSVSMGEQPDGDFVNAVATGSDAGNTSSTPLLANATFTGTAKDTTGFVGIMALVNASHAGGSDGFLIQFAQDSAFTFVHRTVTNTYSDTNNGMPVFAPAMQGEYYRLKYTNGPTDQTRFLIRAELVADAAQIPLGSLSAVAVDSSLATMTRAFVGARAATGIYGNIERGTLGGLDMGIVQHEVPTPIDTNTSLSIRRVSVITTAAEVTGSSPLAGRKTISLKADPDNGNGRIFIGHSSAVTSSTGYELAAGDSVDLDVGPTVTVWAIASAGTLSLCVAEVGAAI